MPTYWVLDVEGDCRGRFRVIVPRTTTAHLHKSLPSSASNRQILNGNPDLSSAFLLSKDPQIGDDKLQPQWSAEILIHMADVAGCFGFEIVRHCP